MNGRAIIEEVAGIMQGMNPIVDRKWKLGKFSELWLCPQLEESANGRRYLTWWVRWIGNAGDALEGHYCEHPALVVVAVTDILEKAGISTK